MYTIGQLAKRFSLSRSTLIYYDSKGLLKPSGRNDSNYRLYTESDAEKLERIILYRNTGLSLAEIHGLLDKNAGEIESALEKRLSTINKEIHVLRQQQKVIIDVLRNQDVIGKTRIVTKDTWVALLRAAGLDEEGMKSWHIEFESISPEAHQDFLESIGIESDEIDSIREWSKSRG